MAGTRELANYYKLINICDARATGEGERYDRWQIGLLGKWRCHQFFRSDWPSPIVRRYLWAQLAICHVPYLPLAVTQRRRLCNELLRMAVRPD